MWAPPLVRCTDLLQGRRYPAWGWPHRGRGLRPSFPLWRFWKLLPCSHPLRSLAAGSQGTDGWRLIPPAWREWKNKAQRFRLQAVVSVSVLSIFIFGIFSNYISPVRPTAHFCWVTFTWNSDLVLVLLLFPRSGTVWLGVQLRTVQGWKLEFLPPLPALCQGGPELRFDKYKMK